MDGLKLLPNSTLSQAMRHWVHAMFGPHQVVVIDGDEPAFKETFSSVMQREVLEGVTHEEVSICNQALESAGFKPQVHVRPCNLFHLTPGGRDRLMASGEGWKSLGGAIGRVPSRCVRTSRHIPKPSRPMRCCRPVYQSQLLPDVAMLLARIGRGGLRDAVAHGVFARLGIEQPSAGTRATVRWSCPGGGRVWRPRQGVAGDGHGAAAQDSMGRWGGRPRGRSCR